MSTLAAGSTGTRTRLRRVDVIPERAELLDAGLLLATSLLALLGLRSTFLGYDYLLVALAGLVLGLLVARLTLAARLPSIVALLGAAVLYFLVGGPLTVRDQTFAVVLPTRASLGALASFVIHGWKQLLTTLPPVAASGPLLAVPLLLGLAAGTGGLMLSRRTSRAGAPLIVPALLVATVVLLGTGRPSTQLAVGGAVAVVGIAWLAVRAARNRPPARGGAAARTRLITAVGVLAVAGVAGVFAGPGLPGAAGDRLVLRTYVTPPFDISDYPSPLVGFRKYTKDAGQLYDQALFTVSGLPSGATMRIATLDGYNGSVWGATNGSVPAAPGQPLDTFQRVGSRVEQPAGGTATTVTVTIGAAYAGAADVAAWLPTPGPVTAVRFDGSDAKAHSVGFRYDLATASGIVPDRLQDGDSYSVDAVVDHADLPADAAPYGDPLVDPSASSFVASRAQQWSDKIAGTVAQVLAVGRHLRQDGAYSDGGPGEAQYLPGHSQGRLTTFLNAPQVVGDDEQYSAAFALMANQLGLPARVVLQAEPEADGSVRGKDVHAGVEVLIASGTSGRWVSVPNAQYMPDASKKPSKQPPESVENANAAVVPPPNTAKPPTTQEQAGQVNSTSRRDAAGQQPAKQGGLPGWLIALAIYGGLPVLGVLLICGAIVGLKNRRRARRRTGGTPSRRYAQGWRELLDHAADLGATVDGQTRREQAAGLSAHAVGAAAAPLYADADAGVFGPGEPATESAAAYWRRVDAARRAMSHATGRRRRVIAALSLRSFRRAARPARSRPVRRSQPARAAQASRRCKPRNVSVMPRAFAFGMPSASSTTARMPEPL